MLSMPRIVRPDPFRSDGTEFGFPVGPATRRSIKRNKELVEPWDWGISASSRTRPYVGPQRLFAQSHLVAGDESEPLVESPSFVGGVEDDPIEALGLRPADDLFQQ
jgi:hypothetical protein